MVSGVLGSANEGKGGGVKSVDSIQVQGGSANLGIKELRWGRHRYMQRGAWVAGDG